MGFTSQTLSEEEIREYFDRTIPRGPDMIREYFDRTIPRGPDMSRIEKTQTGYLCFHRLAIMGLTKEGMQPFHMHGDMCVCNGELYLFRPLKAELERDYTFQSGSDCEIILPLYHKYGLEMFSKLDAEFAMLIYDAEEETLIAARDPIGIRPLFYGTMSDGSMVFASEAKNLVGLCEEICPFPPGHYYYKGQFVRYADVTEVRKTVTGELDDICRKIRELLILGVDKRLDADAPLGFLLSGGLDSSLVCAIAARLLGKPIRTFAIGMDKDAIDLKYARQVAEYIGADHTEVYMTRKQVLESLEEVIALLGTWDITTIRASMGMYLCCKAIHEQTDVRVLLTGEISDELFVHLRQRHRGAGALRGSGVCPLCHEHRSRHEDEHLRHGKIPAPSCLRGRSHAAGFHPVAAEGGLLRRGGPLHGGRSEGVRGRTVYRRGV